jgi:hypothetical protein
VGRFAAQVHFVNWTRLAGRLMVRISIAREENRMLDFARPFGGRRLRDAASGLVALLRLPAFYLAGPLLAAAVTALPLAARADAVLDWNEHALAAVLAARLGPPESARAMAIVHLAVFDAVSSTTNDRGATLAAGAAAHAALVQLLPEQRASVDAAWVAWKQKLGAEVGADGRLEAAVAVGEHAAATCLAMRTADGLGAPNLYKPLTAPGVYVGTALPISYDWRVVKPWFMHDPAQFRPSPPPALASAQWARDYNEIKALGARSGSQRSADQTETARFWANVGAGTWNPVVRALVLAAPSRSILDNARLFATINMAATDAFVAVFDAKYAYNFWRPLTAIRNGESDGNDATAPDPGWLPLLDTPPHPEYPCAHCITASAVATVLVAEFGSGPVSSIAMTSPTAPGVTHHWERIADYASEVSQARIWGGLHYRTSTEVGANMGEAIGRLAVEQGPALVLRAATR